MTPAQFRTIGEALLGPSWQRPLASKLAKSERMVRYWAAGERPIPETIAQQLFTMLHGHAHACVKLANRIAE